MDQNIPVVKQRAESEKKKNWFHVQDVNFSQCVRNISMFVFCSMVSRAPCWLVNAIVCLRISHSIANFFKLHKFETHLAVSEASGISNTAGLWHGKSTSHRVISSIIVRKFLGNLSNVWTELSHDVLFSARVHFGVADTFCFQDVMSRLT